MHWEDEKGVLCKVTSYIPNWAGHGGWARPSHTEGFGKMFVFALSKPCVFLYLGLHTFEIGGTASKRAPGLTCPVMPSLPRFLSPARNLPIVHSLIPHA